MTSEVKRFIICHPQKSRKEEVKIIEAQNILQKKMVFSF